MNIKTINKSDNLITKAQLSDDKKTIRLFTENKEGDVLRRDTFSVDESLLIYRALKEFDLIEDEMVEDTYNVIHDTILEFLDDVNDDMIWAVYDKFDGVILNDIKSWGASDTVVREAIYEVTKRKFGR